MGDFKHETMCQIWHKPSMACNSRGHHARLRRFRQQREVEDHRQVVRSHVGAAPQPERDHAALGQHMVDGQADPGPQRCRQPPVQPCRPAARARPDGPRDLDDGRAEPAVECDRDDDQLIGASLQPTA